MKFLFRILISAVIFVIAAILFFLLVNLRQPDLPATELSPREKQVYEYTLNQLYNGEEGEVGLTFSPREISYFCENVLIEESRYGFELADIYVSRTNGAINIRPAIQGPLGLYYDLEFSGYAYYEEGSWKVYLKSVRIGSIPISWVLPSEYSPNFRDEFMDGRYRLESLNLDGSGLAVRVLQD